MAGTLLTLVGVLLTAIKQCVISVIGYRNKPFPQT
jgi:hypothetical protein